MATLEQFFHADRTTDPRPTDPDVLKYIRSFLWMRVVIGLIGFLLPFVVVLIDGLWFDGSPFPRDSLSAYYYSGVRELFVGGLVACGTFLLGYKSAERSLDSTMSCIAGLGALGVALWPTNRPSDAIGLMPLQDELGETLVATVHYASATIFIGSLAVLSYLFGVREGSREPRPTRRPPAFWRAFHWACTGVIGAAIAWIVVTEIVGGPDESLLIGEAVSVWAFGVSWLAKGAELDTLLGGAAG